VNAFKKSDKLSATLAQSLIDAAMQAMASTI
jgi:hypothetical protein